MRKLFILALILIGVSFGSLALAGGVAPPKNNEALTQDNPNWTGYKYYGFPVKYAADAVGNNVNYLYRVQINFNAEGTAVVQLYTRGRSSGAFNVAKASSSTTQSGIGISEIVFQDSGIIIPRKISGARLYSHSSFKDLVGNQNWEIVTAFNMTGAQADAFISALMVWNNNEKLPFKNISSQEQAFWKN